MDKDEQIREGIRNLVKPMYKESSMIARVSSVDESEKTITVVETIGEEEIEIEDVRLRPVINNGKALVIYPKVDSYVLCLRIEGTGEWMAVGYDQAEKIKWEVDTTVFEIKDGVLIKRGNDTLKEIIQNIIEATQQIVVLYGNNPDYGKLATALTKLNQVLK